MPRTSDDEPHSKIVTGITTPLQHVDYTRFPNFDEHYIILMSSDSHSTSTSTERPEADPLPPKIGERGYVPTSIPEMTQSSPQDERVVLPARHPADHDAEPTPAPGNNAPPPATNSTPTPNQASSIRKSWKQRLSLGGISPLTLARIVILLIFLAATSAAWGIIIIHFSAAKAIASNPSGDGSSDNGYDGFNSPAFSSVVIVHISFTIVILVELLFLERSIFHARAERYLYKNGMQRGGANASMGIAPWNRPPLPTYAAALAEIGVGTGDVEDNMIAIAPPPAYGNYRGSTLILAGALRESLIRSLNRSSQQSENSAQRQPDQVPSPRELEEGRGSRPISYDASEEADNAKRARELEAALARLETNNNSNGNP